MNFGMINILEKIYCSAQADLENSFDSLNQKILEFKDDKIGEFILRCLDWYTDKSKKQLLWELFHEVWDFSLLGFVASLDAFVANSLLDDYSFVVEWRVYLYKDNRPVFDNSKFGIKTTLSTRGNENSFPVVVGVGGASQDVSLLMEAMDEKERRERKRLEAFSKEA